MRRREVDRQGRKEVELIKTVTVAVMACLGVDLQSDGTGGSAAITRRLKPADICRTKLDWVRTKHSSRRAYKVSGGHVTLIDGAERHVLWWPSGFGDDYKPAATAVTSDLHKQLTHCDCEGCLSSRVVKSERSSIPQRLGYCAAGTLLTLVAGSVLMGSAVLSLGIIGWLLSAL